MKVRHETNDGSKMMRGQTTIDEKALEIVALKINKEYEEKVASSTNEELIEAIEVWKIYKLLQRMKTKEVSTHKRI